MTEKTKFTIFIYPPNNGPTTVIDGVELNDIIISEGVLKFKSKEGKSRATNCGFYIKEEE